MGMDLLPRRGKNSIHYNWSGGRSLITLLDGYGVDTTEFAGNNDATPICAATCRAVADAIEARRDQYNSLYGGTPKDQGGYGDDPATDAAEAWRNAGGVRQW